MLLPDSLTAPAEAFVFLHVANLPVVIGVFL